MHAAHFSTYLSHFLSFRAKILRAYTSHWVVHEHTCRYCSLLFVVHECVVHCCLLFILTKILRIYTPHWVVYRYLYQFWSSLFIVHAHGCSLLFMIHFAPKIHNCINILHHSRPVDTLAMCMHACVKMGMVHENRFFRHKSHLLIYLFIYLFMCTNFKTIFKLSQDLFLEYECLYKL